MTPTRSIRLRFDNRQPDDLKLTHAVPCIALAPPSDDLGSRDSITGFWVQLEGADQQVLYRKDYPGLMVPLSAESHDQELRFFYALVPYMTDAKTVAIFAPPRIANGTLPALGSASILVRRFTFPPIEEPPHQVQVNLPSDICGSGRGLVLSVTNLVNHGTKDNIYNFVVLADKFGNSGQASFAKYASNCINYLLSRPPFDSVLGSDAMNIYLVEVASNNSSPSYFNSTYSSGSTAINWDTECVRTVCDALFSEGNKPYWNWAGIVVNYDSDRIGTARGNQFASGLYTDFWDPFRSTKDYMLTFQHEFGHAAFGLGDEYDGTSGTYEGAEPNSPNLTKETTAVNLKWNALLTPGINIPTLGNPSNCGKEDKRSNPVSDSDVGSYAGGRKYSCGIFHPQYKCVMNDQSEANGNYCAVCLHEATKIVARSAPLLVPAPGSIYYSPVSQAWSHVLVAANVTNSYGDLQNYATFQSVVDELIAKNVGPAVRGAFIARQHPLPGDDFEVVLSYYNAGANVDGVWYLISKLTLNTYFIHAYKVGGYSNLHIGKILLPDFPSLTRFDGAVVGTEINLFCGDGGTLSYGKLNSSGNIEGAGMVVQTVTGLNNNVSGLSVDFVSSRIWVVVVDNLSVKIAAYELLNARWWSDGFITMPVSTPTDFNSVRIVQVGNSIHVLAQAASGLYYNTFSALSKTWEGNATLTPITASIAYYDVGSDGKNLYLIANDASTTSSFRYSIASRQWNAPTDITAALGLVPTDALSSLGLAVLKGKLYVIALVNQLPEYAIYDILSNTWITPLTTINPLQSLHSEMGAMMVHATASQIYVGLSALG